MVEWQNSCLEEAYVRLACWGDFLSIYASYLSYSSWIRIMACNELQPRNGWLWICPISQCMYRLYRATSNWSSTLFGFQNIKKGQKEKIANGFDEEIIGIIIILQARLYLSVTFICQCYLIFPTQYNDYCILVYNVVLHSQWLDLISPFTFIHK